MKIKTIKKIVKKIKLLKNKLISLKVRMSYLVNRNLSSKVSMSYWVNRNLSSKAGTDLLIFDDVFPHKLSPFRYVEFNEYLRHFKSIMIASTGFSLSCLNETKTISQVINEFITEKPQYSNKIKPVKCNDKFNAKLVYVNFLGNAVRHGLADDLQIPFVINLYPGGSFYLNDAETDYHLKTVLFSPYFRKVIVTQKITYDYLLKKNFCKPDQIEFIFGVVIPEEMLKLKVENKKRFGFEKDILDICFVAHKSTGCGENKGYDKFIEVAHNLVEKYDNIRFHVVGSFDEKVLDVSKLGDRIKFYGLQQTEWFIEFYKDKDIILSPNVPFLTKPASFDGFPTACVTDAGLNELAMFASDELKLNENRFVEDNEIVIIKPNAKDIEEKIEFYYNNPGKLRNIALNGAKKIKELYSFEKQIQRRIEILENELYKGNKLIQEVSKTIRKNIANQYEDVECIPLFGDKIKKVKIARQFNMSNWQKKLSDISELYCSLSDKNSKKLLVLLCTYKILGPTKIKLPLYDKKKWLGYYELENNIIEKTDIESLIGKFNIYDMKRFGYNLKLLYSQFGAFVSFILEQYRYKNICKTEKGDYVIDGGACCGDSALYFADLVGEAGKVFSFEFIPSNIELFNKNMQLNPKHKKRIDLIKRPLGINSTDILYGIDNGPASTTSMNPSKNSEKYTTICIDDLVREKNIRKIDFIKLDIEGAEVDALHGAMETIKKFKPKLAIAIYHKDDDFITIPALIKSFNPNYKFYIEHYTVQAWETVLYAVDRRN